MQYILPFQFNASPLRLLRHNPPADAESVNKKHSAGTVWSSLHSINGLAPFSHNLVCPLNLLFHIIHHGKKIRVTDLELNVHMVTHDNFLFTNQKFRMINIIFLIIPEQWIVLRIISLAIGNQADYLSPKCLFIHLDCLSAVTAEVQGRYNLHIGPPP